MTGELVYSAKIDLIPPTTNNLYITTKAGRRYPNPKFASLNVKIADSLPKVALNPAWYALRISLFTSIYTKTGKNHARVKKFDASNRIKLLEDELSTAVGLDDMFFKSVTIEKYNSTEDWTFIELFHLSWLPNDWTIDDGEVKMVPVFNKERNLWVLQEK
jgi:Holliday junction resolvase RusA-like endonuclease